jgi:hypothetical protein
VPTARLRRFVRLCVRPSTSRFAFNRAVGLPKPRSSALADDDVGSLMRRAELLRSVAFTISDAKALEVLEQVASELTTKAEALLSETPPSDDK